jgi:hypothetical protein
VAIVIVCARRPSGRPPASRRESSAPADEQHRQARPELLARSGEQRVRVLGADAEHGRDLARIKALAQLELDDLTLLRVQPVPGVLKQGAQVGAPASWPMPTESSVTSGASPSAGAP